MMLTQYLSTYLELAMPPGTNKVARALDYYETLDMHQ